MKYMLFTRSQLSLLISAGFLIGAAFSPVAAQQNYKGPSIRHVAPATSVDMRNLEKRPELTGSQTYLPGPGLVNPKSFKALPAASS